MKNFLLTLFVSMLCIQKFALANFNSGMDAVKKSEYDTAFKEFKNCETQPECQYGLGMLYYLGYGVPKNPKIAFEWLSSAASKNQSDAQFELSNFYLTGEANIIKDQKKAKDLLESSAKLGNPNAQYKIASNIISEKNENEFPKAFELLLKAANKNHALSQNLLGIMYKNGWGTHVDFQKAAALFQEASRTGNASAYFNLARLYFYGQGVSKNHLEAARLYQIAAELGLLDAQLNLAAMYDGEANFARNPVEALKWYQLAATQGHSVAQYNTGLFYEKGEGANIDLAKAFHWYSKAANQGSSEAINNLGSMYLHGNYVSVNRSMALSLFLQAADLGNPLAMVNAGNEYITSVNSNYIKLISYFLHTLAIQNVTDNYKVRLNYWMSSRTDLQKSLSTTDLATAERLLNEVKQGGKVSVIVSRVAMSGR